MKNKVNYIFDFDSTIIDREGLEELAEICLQQKENKEEILARIKNITDAGMKGEMDFPTSLAKRLELLELHYSHLEEAKERLKRCITPSVQRNKEFFANNKDNIYIISGGFKECISPVVREFFIEEKNIWANQFRFDEHERAVDFVRDNYLAGANGKSEQIRALRPQGKVVMVGDGWTDYLPRKEGIVDEFIAFTENKRREEVVRVADREIRKLEELIDC